MSSEEAAAADNIVCCANCGISAIDDVELMMCHDCDLVKYCGDLCQQNHREQHEEKCKKRADELRDRDLFTLPDSSHMGECPICCLPLSIDLQKSAMMSCCSKYICKGCSYANTMREFEAGLENRCAFCREPVANEFEEHYKHIMKRIKKNCPVAMYQAGGMCFDKGDYESALKYLTKAAELGDAGAHYNLSLMYREGDGVEKDEKKKIYHLEEAAIRGHAWARHNLGNAEWINRRFERARKHYIIAANLGYHDSLKEIQYLYAHGLASKEDYADALRAYQAAVEATKSAERKKGEAYYEAVDAARQS